MHEEHATRPETSQEFLARMRSVGVIGRRSGNRVREGRDGQGRRFKAVKDELGHVVTERDVPGGRQDVMINADTVKMKIGVQQ